jgi:hypothetical protein
MEYRLYDRSMADYVREEFFISQDFSSILILECGGGFEIFLKDEMNDVYGDKYILIRGGNE